MIPPTPVAAPWYGSTADGWLWLSMRIGDGEAVTDVDHAGALTRADEHPRRLGREPPEIPREDLYEQCSDHITAYIASSSSWARGPARLRWPAARRR